MYRSSSPRFWISLVTLLALLPGFFTWLGSAMPAVAADAQPASVSIPGSYQSEVGCAGDWDPACAITHLAYDASDDAWQASFTIPAGDWEYKAALNDSWDENYGLHAIRNGANIPLSLSDTTTVKFYYDHKTHWVTDNHTTLIITAPGNYQDEIGCPGDWQPDCLRSWLEDPDGDGIFTFTTNQIPAGHYEAKAAINESWDLNYGLGGVQNGPNIPFDVPVNGAQVRFIFDAHTHVLTISAGHAHDNNVEYFGLGHDSHNSLYRVPFGAITPGTPLILRFRTYHNDVTGVRVRFYDTAASREFFATMSIAASGVSCYDPAQPNESCDFWQAVYIPPAPTTLYYRFIVTDGSASAYYADDGLFNGGWGQATPAMIDNSYAVTVYDPAFQPVTWMQSGIVYQIFPDRFRDGRANNQPSSSELRYGYPPVTQDQILVKTWNDFPEGYCRGYVNPAQPCTESPRGRDYFGGDLRGVQQRLNYLQSLGVTVIYFNPIFESASDHGYDTQDYYQIEHFFGDLKDFQDLIAHAHKRGIRVVLDGVFNHVSSDSPYFDRYHHFDTVGACESPQSPYRDWFYFHDVAPGAGPCAGSDGTPQAATYDSWAGFDSLPVLNKSNPDVQALIYTRTDSVARYWLNQGADGWRLDVMVDSSFPAGFWQGFRQAVKETKNDAVIIGELWKKFDVLPYIHGDQADSTMNYRFRNAILGFFGTVDNKGFPDDGQSNQPPSLFADKLTSIREDNPDASYYTMMNLLDSHDTKRILWSLTPGQNNREDKELNAANLAAGKQLLRLAVAVQMTVPGAPTIYYGDEVGVTGDDDPDDRRTFPWSDTGPYGVGGDAELMTYYKSLIALRKANPVFSQGQLTFLLTDDANRTLAYLLRTPDQAAIVAVNRSDRPQTLTIDAHGRIPDAARFYDALGAAGSLTANQGVISLSLPGLSAAILLPDAGQDLTTPAAPQGLDARPGNGLVELAWQTVSDAAAYRVYRSPLTGGGFQFIGETQAPSFSDSGVINGQHYFYVVRSVDAAGNESTTSNEAAATPFAPIGYAVLQWPYTITKELSVHPTETIYGRVYVAGVTDAGGDPASILAQVGFGPQGSDPESWDTWVDMSYNAGHSGDNNYEYMGSLRPEVVGTFDYLVRFSTDGGLNWAYGDQDGFYPGESGTDMPGVLAVTPNPDTTPPEAPANLRVADWSASSITLAWDAVSDAAEYWLYRSESSGTYGAPLVKLDASQTGYVDASVAGGVPYFYVVRAVDEALNLSAPSNEVSQIAQPKLVQVTFRVRVPPETPPTDTVYIPGNIDLLGPWNPGKQPMTNMGGGIWEVTLPLLDGTSLEYKYTRGSWERVEWWGGITGTVNRHLTVSYGSDGTQLVDNTATDWGNGPDEQKAVQYWRDPLVASTSASASQVTVNFSRGIQPLADADFSSAIVVKSNGSPVTGSVSPLSGVTTMLTWTPGVPLSQGTYEVAVFNLQSSVDGDHVPMQQPYVFTFTVP